MEEEGSGGVAIVDVGVGAGKEEGAKASGFWGGNRQCEAGLWDWEACDQGRANGLTRTALVGSWT